MTKMKVLITGSNGFIGTNLQKTLMERNINFITFDQNDSIDKIKSNLEDIDFVYHFAAVMRPVDKQDFYKINYELTKEIIDIIKIKRIPMLLTSSIHAEGDTDYGISKKMAEDCVRNYSNEYKTKTYIYRLTNSFGPYCKPNYSSVVATFCNNICYNKDIVINNPDAEINLIYIEDIINEFIDILGGSKKSEDYYSINPSYKVTLADLANKIYNIKNQNNAELNSDFDKKLIKTYKFYEEKGNEDYER